MDTVDRDNDSTIPAKPIQKRCQYSNALKWHIVEQNLADHDSIFVAARRYAVNANQLFKWRRQYRAGFLVDELEPQSLVPITVTPSPALKSVPEAAAKTAPTRVVWRLHSIVDIDSLSPARSGHRHCEQC
jgi:transposase-like protein